MDFQVPERPAGTRYPLNTERMIQRTDEWTVEQDTGPVTDSRVSYFTFIGLSFLINEMGIIIHVS